MPLQFSAAASETFRLALSPPLDADLSLTSQQSLVILLVDQDPEHGELLDTVSVPKEDFDGTLTMLYGYQLQITTQFLRQ